MIPVWPLYQHLLSEGPASRILWLIICKILPVKKSFTTAIMSAVEGSTAKRWKMSRRKGTSSSAAPSLSHGLQTQLQRSQKRIPWTFLELRLHIIRYLVVPCRSLSAAGRTYQIIYSPNLPEGILVAIRQLFNDSVSVLNYCRGYSILVHLTHAALPSREDSLNALRVLFRFTKFHIMLSIPHVCPSNAEVFCHYASETTAYPRNPSGCRECRTSVRDRRRVRRY